ncbi:MAG: Uma2 family endonuclease [Gemmatimonadaceae bacterium]
MPDLKRRWTVVERDELPDDGNRYEVIDGELLVSPSPTLRHQEAVFQLARLIASYLERQRVGHAFIAPGDIVFSPRRGVQPDMFVLPLAGGRRPERFEKLKGLVLAVEILSPSTARADRVAKRNVFRDEGVPEYWVVDLDARTVERSTPSESRIELCDEKIEWLPDGASEPLVIDLVDYFHRVLDR